VVAIGIVIACTCVAPSFIKEFEDEAVFSVGIAGEAKYPEIDLDDMYSEPFLPEKDDILKNNSVIEKSCEPVDGSVIEETEPLSPFPEENNVAEEERKNVFDVGGRVDIAVNERFDHTFREELESKIKSAFSEEEIDYTYFASTDKMTPLIVSLDQEEIAFIFSELTDIYTRSLPIRCDLTNISFRVEEELLYVRASIEVIFDELIKRYQFTQIPTSALFVIEGSFELENSEICVHSEDISLSCESIPLSEKLMLFGCTIIFGKKDHRAIFADAVKNVFVNAGIYR